MPDPFQNLEQELQSLTPLPPSDSLDRRILAHIQNPSPRRPLADRILLSTLTTALAASLLILTLLLTDNPSTSPAPIARTPQSFTLADTPRLLAQLTSPDSNPSHPAPSTFPN